MLNCSEACYNYQTRFVYQNMARHKRSYMPRCPCIFLRLGEKYAITISYQLGFNAFISGLSEREKEVEREREGGILL